MCVCARVCMCVKQKNKRNKAVCVCVCVRVCACVCVLDDAWLLKVSSSSALSLCPARHGRPRHGTGRVRATRVRPPSLTHRHALVVLVEGPPGAQQLDDLCMHE